MRRTSSDSVYYSSLKASACPQHRSTAVKPHLGHSIRHAGLNVATSSKILNSYCNEIHAKTAWLSFCCSHTPAQMCCRVLSAECSSTDENSEDDESPWWQLVGLLLPPFLHGLCMCVDRPKIAEGMLPPLVSILAVVPHSRYWRSDAVRNTVCDAWSYPQCTLRLYRRRPQSNCRACLPPSGALTILFLLTRSTCYSRCACLRCCLAVSAGTAWRRLLHRWRRKSCGKHSSPIRRKDSPWPRPGGIQFEPLSKLTR